jgi:hypothetical protein
MSVLSLSARGFCFAHGRDRTHHAGRIDTDRIDPGFLAIDLLSLPVDLDRVSSGELISLKF